MTAPEPSSPRRTTAALLLLLVAFLWGTSFASMKLALTAELDGRPAVGILTFVGTRFLLAALSVLPFVLLESRRTTRPPLGLRTTGAFMLLGGLLFSYALVNQIGVKDTTVTNSGFLTSLYVPLIPVFVFVLFRQTVRPMIWIGVGGCFLGSCLLTGVIPAGFDRLHPADVWVMASAVLFAFHVIGMGVFSARWERPVTLAFIQFLVTGLLASAGALILESPDLRGILFIWKELAYAGILAGGLAYALQASAQQVVPAPATAILLSMEMVFAAAAGAVVLGERLETLQWFGAVLIFGFLLAVEVGPLLRRHRTRAAHLASDPASGRPPSCGDETAVGSGE
nr:DMT family transporter [Phaeovibrio sulfidiphilus]